MTRMVTTTHATARQPASTVIVRAMIVWAGILVLAILNGGLREGVITPAWGPTTGHVLSTLLLIGAILAVTVLTIRWIGPGSTIRAVWLGFLWMGLTLAFEFLAGRYVFGATWESLLADYNMLAGRIWPLVPLTMLFAPVLMYRKYGRRRAIRRSNRVG
jgi:hypothetical protein